MALDKGKWVTVPGNKTLSGKSERRWQMESGQLRNTEPGTSDFYDQQYMQPLKSAWTAISGSERRAANAAILSPKSEADDTTIQPRVYDGKTKPRVPGWEDAGDKKYQDIAKNGWVPPIDTTQNANTPIVMRSHNEEYVQKKAQWGGNPDVKAAADKGFETGKAYREGDPYDTVPEYINAGSKEYMERADQKVWAKANPEAAAALRAKGERREARWAERERTQNAAFNRKDGGFAASEGAEAIGRGSLAGSSSTPASLGAGAIGRASYGKGPEASGSSDDGARSIGAASGQDRQTFNDTNSFDIGKAAALDKARNFDNGLKEVQEAAITDSMDQNPGMTRGQAAQNLRAGRTPDRAQASPLARSVPTGYEVTPEALDIQMERSGQRRNQAVDMVRSPEPMAHLEMGVQYSNPGLNRSTANRPLQRASFSQAAATGSATGRNMQPSSGLNDVSTVKAPLKYEQGNVHSHLDQDAQEQSDHISADRFAFEAAQQIGRQLHGADYSPARERPLF